MADSPQSFESLMSLLAAHGQEHVLRYWDQLSQSQQDRLRQQIASLDLDLLDTLLAGTDAEKDFAALAAAAESPSGGLCGWQRSVLDA